MFAPTSIARAATRLAAAAALTASIGLAPVALAADVNRQDKMPSSYAAIMKMKAIDVMHMMDGGKGHVTREDFMKFHEELFARMDTNKDGRISEAEWLARTDRSKDAGG